MIDAIDGLKDIGDVKKLINMTGASKDVAQTAMEMSRFSDDAEAVADVVASVGDGISNVSTKSESLGNIFTGLGATLKSIAPVALTLLGVFAAYKTFKFLDDKFTLTYGTATKHLDESVGNYNEAKEDLNSINSQLETTSARISELQSKDKLTLTEQSELDKLQLQNDLLKRQKEIKESIVTNEQKEAAEAAEKKLEYASEKSYVKDKNGNFQIDRLGNTRATSVSRIDKVKENIEALKEEQSLLESINKQLDSGKNETGKTLSKKEKNALKTDFENTTKQIDDYKKSISKMVDDINSDATSLYDEKTGLALSGYEKQVKEIESLNDSYLEAVEGKTAKVAKAMDDIWKEPKFAEAQQKLVDAFRSGEDLSVKDIAKDFPELVSACNDAGISVETLRNELQALSEQDAGMTQLETDFAKFQTTAVSLINSMDIINAAMANSFSGKGLSIDIDEETGALTGDLVNIADAYKHLDGYDASVLFEKTANGVHLNREALRQLQAQQEANMKTDFINQQTALQDRLNEALAEQKNYQIDSADYNNSQAVINDLQSQLETVQQLSAAYDGATSAYQKWIDSQSNGEEGDMFRTVSDTMKERGNELFKEGRYNTEEFRAIADYFSYEDLSTAPMEKLVEAYQNATNARDAYFTGNKQGIDNFMTDMMRISEEEGRDWITETQEGFIKFNTGADEEIAQRFNLSKEAIQTLYRAATEYNDKIALGDTGGIDTTAESIEKMKQKAEDAKNKLKELSEASQNGLSYDFNFDSTDVADLDSQMARATANLDQFKNESGQIDLSLEGAQEATTILQTLIQQKQLVTQPAIMSVDTNGLDGDVANVVSKLKEYQTALNELNALNDLQSVGIPVDTSQIDSAKEKVNTVFSELQEMSTDGNLEINADVSVDTSSTDSLTADLAAMTPEITAKINPDTSNLNTVDTTLASNATVNYTKGSQEEPTDKNAKVNYTKGLQYKAEDRNAKVNYTKGTQAPPTSPKTATVNYTLGTVATPPSVTVKVNYDTSGAPSSHGVEHVFNGTAHATGTAFASGDWSIKKNQKALVGELGTEVVVRNGKFFTVGDNGAEFTNLKSGDIVFNHKQSEELFKNGHVTSGGGRAKVVMGGYAEGTAYSNGTWTFGNTGNGNIGGTGSTPSNWSPTYNTPDPAPVQAVAKATQDAADSAEEFSEEIDHIQNKIDRIERAIKNIAIISGSSFETYATRFSALSDQIATVTDEINIQQQAYDRYMQQANSVSLSQDYKDKIANGTIDIETITDKDLNENIKSYQEWYENALDCRDAINELKESVRELYQEAFDNLVTQYDNILGQIEHKRNILEGFIDQTEAKGYLVSQKYYDALISNEEKTLAELTEKRAKLIESLNTAMDNGNIQEGSDAWYEMQSEINDVNEAIQEANTSIIEYGNSIRELQWDVFNKIQDSISSITSESDFLVKLMSSKDLYDDKGNITDEGKASMGLHGVNYNTYMSQADEYRKEMEAIQAELAKDPYNQDLIERRKELLELQQESILAAEDEKNAIKDLVEDGINKQLKALRDLIDEYKNTLDEHHDLYDYQKRVADFQKEIAIIEKQIAAYKNDNSEEGSANKQKLQTDLKEAQENLEETQYEKSIADQKKLLDELYTEYETVINMRLDNIDQLIADVIGNINAESAGIRDTIISEANNVGYQITDSMRTIWTDSSNGIVNAITTYGNNFTNAVTGVQTAINNIKVLIQDAINASNKDAETNITNANNAQAEQTTPAPAPTPAPKPKPSNSGDGVARVGDKVTLKKGQSYYYDSWGTSPAGNMYSGVTGGVVIDSYSGSEYGGQSKSHGGYGIHIKSADGKYSDLGWVKLDQISGYKNGTDNVPKDGQYWTQEGANGKSASETIIRKKDGAILTPLNQGDKVLSHEATTRLFEFANGTGNYSRDIGNLSNIPQVQSTNTSQSINNDVQVNIEIKKANDFNDFMRQFQQEPKVEKLVQAMTTDQAAGKSKMAKYNIKF